MNAKSNASFIESTLTACIIQQLLSLHCNYSYHYIQDCDVAVCGWRLMDFLVVVVVCYAAVITAAVAAAV